MPRSSHHLWYITRIILGEAFTLWSSPPPPRMKHHGIAIASISNEANVLTKSSRLQRIRFQFWDELPSVAMCEVLLTSLCLFSLHKFIYLFFINFWSYMLSNKVRHFDGEWNFHDNIP
jgi:hypothetical protein